MNKKSIYLWLIAIIVMASACNNEECVSNYSSENNRVTIGTNINQDLKTRTKGPSILAGYTMRYVLEVWQSDKNIYRDEKLQQAESTTFSFNLETKGEYKVLVWADYIKESPESSEETSPNTFNHYTDLYYQTNTANGLKEVTIIPENYIINDASRDAYCVCQTITKSDEALNQTLTLNRPFAQLNIMEKNSTLLEKVQKLTSSYKVPETYNVETGQQGNSYIDIKSTIETLPNTENHHKANLLYDYIFAPVGVSSYLSPITLAFESKDPQFTLNSFTLAENNIPLLRNKRTIAQGTILKLSSVGSKETNITIQIDEEWLADVNQAITEPEKNSTLSDFLNQNNPFIKQ